MKCFISQRKTIIIVAAIAISTLMSSCSHKNNTKAGPDTLAVEVINLGKDHNQGSQQTNYDGTLQADKAIDLSFQVSGTVTSFPVKAGDYVNKGQLVAQVDETTYRNQYNAQLAQAKLAEENYRRMDEVYRKGSIAEIKMLEARSNFEQATSAAKATYQNIAHTRLYAPQSGYIGDKKVEAGGVANPGQPIAQLLETGSIQALVAVPESEVNRFPKGTPAVIKVDALAGRVFNGVVSEVGVLAVNGTANYNVKVKLTNADHVLKPGMLSKVNFLSSKKSADTADSAGVLVPVQAVQVDEQGNRFVYLAGADNKAERKMVKTGRLYSNGIAITEGLKGDERLITSGYQKLSDQTPVTILNK